MALISIEHLSKCYRIDKSAPAMGASVLTNRLLRRRPPTRRAPREIWALDDINVQVDRGTILGVIGPNGAGKTTLLKILGRVTLPTRGRVVGHGRVVSLLALGSGFQPDLSGRENVHLQAALYGVPGSEVSRRFDEIAEFAELGDLMEMQVRRYSSGMYIRLAFSAAIHMNGDILLADEVLAVGDLAFQERCLQRVEQAGQEGMTVLFVSHDMSAIRRLCHRVIWLDSGHLIEDGDTERVVSLYEQRARQGATTRAGATANEHAQIVSTRLLGPTGEEAGALRVEESGSLETTLEVFTPGIEIRCNFAIAARGTLVMRTLMPDGFVATEPGIYHFRARIPPDLLSDTTYTIKAGVALRHDGQETFLVRDDAIVFTVYAVDDEVLLWGDYRERAGLVSPRLEWQVVEERDHVLA